MLFRSENLKDLDQVPIEVKSELEFVGVNKVEEVIKELFDLDLPAATNESFDYEAPIAPTFNA